MGLLASLRWVSTASIIAAAEGSKRAATSDLGCERGE